MLYLSLSTRRTSMNLSLQVLISVDSFCTFIRSPKSPEFLHDNLLKSCLDVPPLKQIHSVLTKSDLITKSCHVRAQIIIKYALLGDTISARSVFNDVDVHGDKQNSFMWNTMIRAYANGEQYLETIELYRRMRDFGISPDNYTFPFLCKACASRSMMCYGRLVHGDAVKTGFGFDVYVEGALVSMYAKSGDIDCAREVFDEMPVRDLVCWTTMMTAYEQDGNPKEVLFLFREMNKRGLSADSITVVTLSSAIGQLGDTRMAQDIHSYAIRNFFLEELSVVNSVITMYMKCGNMEKARLVFDMMEERNVVSWNSLLSGYSQNGQASEALLVFDEMCQSKVHPNPTTALIMVTVGAYLGSHDLARKLQAFCFNVNRQMDVILWNALIGMHAKCGDLETAENLFYEIHPSERSVSSWNTLISSYGMHGHGKEALKLFSRMQKECVEPNHITVTAVLSACSHAGLINEGKECFANIKKLPFEMEAKHYACMVDMFGRAGLVQEAYELIKEMPIPPNDDVWGALLLACKIHGNMELGEIAADNLLKLEPLHAGYYVLMSNVYAASNRWQEVGKVREDMKDKGLNKPAAFSIIDCGKEIHGFYTADHENPYSQEVHKRVESLVVEMKMAGYVPDLSCALHDVEDEDKECMLNYHSEKLAVAFGILKIGIEMPIRVTKNIRVCNDCHTAFKLISFIHKRNIILRDLNRFHHFEGGVCSCNDYW